MRKNTTIPKANIKFGFFKISVENISLGAFIAWGVIGLLVGAAIFWGLISWAIVSLLAVLATGPSFWGLFWVIVPLLLLLMLIVGEKKE